MHIDISILEGILDAINSIEAHPVLIGGILVLIGQTYFRKYFKQKQSEACFGFYINFTLRILRLRQYVLTNPNIFNWAYSDDVRNSYGLSTPITSIAEDLTDFSKEFIIFITSVENNIPPNDDWDTWFSCQKTLMKFLHWIVAGHYAFFEDYYEADNTTPTYELEKSKLLSALDALENLIKTKTKEVRRSTKKNIFHIVSHRKKQPTLDLD